MDDIFQWPHGSASATIRSTMKQVVGVLDSSFWSLASHLNLETYIFDLFARPIICPRSVREELDPSTSSMSLVYPHQQRFRVAIQDQRINVVEDPDPPYPKYGRGEAAAIQLAISYRERGEDALLLINDYRPYTEAAQVLGLVVLSVPELPVVLVYAGLRTPSAALADLLQMKDHTSDHLIAHARKMIQDAVPMEGAQDEDN